MDNTKGEKKMKKVMSMALALMLLLSGSFSCFALSDTDGTAYATAVDALVKKGYISGYGDDTFRPERTLSRAEACSIIVSFKGATAADMKAAKPAGFHDMGAYQWAEDAVNYAVANGILSGYADKTFRPGKEVSYAELAVMVVNAMGQKDLVKGNWDTGYMQVASAQGYLKGTVGLNAAKDLAKPSTRGNTAIIVYNADQARTPAKDDQPDNTSASLSNFSGYAYGAINSFSEALNADDDKVKEIEFLFGDSIQQLQTKKSFTPNMDIAFDGTLYCLRLDNGLVTKIATKDTVEANNMKVKKFTELTDGYQEVTQKEDNEVLFVKDGDGKQLLELNDRCSIYVATVDGKDATAETAGSVDGYRPGSYRDIRKGDRVRAYDVTKDDDCADVIFLLRK